MWIFLSFVFRVWVCNPTPGFLWVLRDDMRCDSDSVEVELVYFKGLMRVYWY